MKKIIPIGFLVSLLSLNFMNYSMNYPLLYPEHGQIPVAVPQNHHAPQNQQQAQILDENRIRIIVHEELIDHEQRLLNAQNRILNKSIAKVAMATLVGYIIYKLYTKQRNTNKNTHNFYTSKKR